MWAVLSLWQNIGYKVILMIICSSFNNVALLQSLLANVSMPQSRGMRHYGGRSMTAATKVHPVFTTYDVFCVLFT